MNKSQLNLDLRYTKGNRDSKKSDIPREPLVPSSFVRLSPPKTTTVFRTYWTFAAERQRLFYARLTGNQAQQTEDLILSRYRFTNTYRASDRVSQYLIRNVIYSGQWQPEDLFFRILLFKFFNKIETWEALESALGEIRWQSYRYSDYDRVLASHSADGQSIYSGAYIMASGKSQIGNDRKYQNHLRIIEMMMEDCMPKKISQQNNLESIYRLLRVYPCIGPFVGYQFSIDLNYSSLVEFSENDFVEAGPGALDGITKCFSDLGDYTPNDIIRYMVDVQEKAFSSFDINFCDLWGRSLHLIDCQNVFCEVDKYTRVAYPSIAGRSGRRKIKRIYSPSGRQLPEPFYPPNWKINEQIVEMLKSIRVGDRSDSLPVT